MSLHPKQSASVPEDTSRVARAAFPNGTLCLHIAEALGQVYQDDQFKELFPRRGQPAEAPGRLALATVLQYVEGLSDRQPADAVRGRIDWKYALGLSLTNPGFDHTVLSEFRSRLVEGGAERLLLDTLLQLLRDQGLVKAGGRQRTDSTHVLAAVRRLNRLERAGETVRAALNDLATVAPDWLRSLAPEVWYDRYGRRVENYRLPKTDAARLELATTIGADGRQLLAAVDAAADRPWLAQLPTVGVLREVWKAQYIEEDGKLRWRTVREMPAAAEQISSPYDPEARYSTKREISWVGYKVHLTETCDPEAPHVITNVETTLATTPDDNMVAVVHQSLEQNSLLPSEHLVDKGYTDSRVLVDSRQRHDVTIIGPVADDPSWQAPPATDSPRLSFRLIGIERWSRARRASRASPGCQIPGPRTA
jgi:transposase